MEAGPPFPTPTWPAPRVSEQSQRATWIHVSGRVRSPGRRRKARRTGRREDAAGLQGPTRQGILCRRTGILRFLMAGSPVVQDEPPPVRPARPARTVPPRTEQRRLTIGSGSSPFSCSFGTAARVPAAAPTCATTGDCTAPASLTTTASEISLTTTASEISPCRRQMPAGGSDRRRTSPVVRRGNRQRGFARFLSGIRHRSVTRPPTRPGGCPGRGGPIARGARPAGGRRSTSCRHPRDVC